MSNLKMPTMTLEALTPKLKEGESKRIAHNTWAYLYSNGSISIIYHRSVIAEISEGGSKVYITNAGWGTPTTRNRLDHVLRDNGIPFYVTQKNFVQVLVNGASGEVHPHFNSAVFWDGNLTYLNGGEVE